MGLEKRTREICAQGDGQDRKLNRMTPKDRVEKCLHGGHADKVPFTIYEGYQIPQCLAEREMRNRDLCIYRRCSVYKTLRPNVKTKTEVWIENGHEFHRTYHETSAGTLTWLHENAGYTWWVHEKMFKSPDDYKKILAFIKDAYYEPDYEAFIRKDMEFGGDAIMGAGAPGEPLQALITGLLMKTDVFCIEWMDNRDEILKLYDALVESSRKAYPIVAKSPATHVGLGGNVMASVVGVENFEKYYLPNYLEAAEIMHNHGKLVGSHLDSHCRLLSKSIAQSALDYIEAFTPAPDTDMTLGEARAAWPGKTLWINFPSSVHLKSDREVEQTTVDLLNQLESVDGVIFGITEDMPPDRWRDSCRAIMDGLDRHAHENPKMYN